MAAQKEFDAFLSYAREDLTQAERLVHELRRAGFSVWFDRDQLLPGQNWRTEIENAIPRCLTFLALASERSVNKVGFVQRELKVALDFIDLLPQNLPFVIPVRLDSSEPTHGRLRDIQWLDLFESWQVGIEKLVKSIRLARQLRSRTSPAISARALVMIRFETIDAALPLVQSLSARSEVENFWLAEGEYDLIAMLAVSDVATLIDAGDWIKAQRGVSSAHLQLIVAIDE